MNFQSYTRSTTSSFEANQVVRNTYALLGMTLLFSAATAWVSMLLRLPHPGFVGTLVGFYGLYFLTHHYSDSAMGVFTAFLFSGFTGYTLGPILTHILHFYANGSAIIGMAFTMTATVFLSLSAYIFSSGRSFSYIGGITSIGAIVAIVASLFSMLFPSAILEIISSSLFALVSSGYIMYHTSEIISGGERNYIIATLALYISIYNLFISFLHLLSIFGGRQD